jgi:uncharacterized protein YycO
MTRKIYCSPSIWAKEATRAAQTAEVCPVQVLSGSMKKEHTAIRWAVWRDLVGRGYSYSSIGRAGGYDHTSVRYACIVGRESRRGRNKKEVSP